MYRLTFVALAFFLFLPASAAHAQTGPTVQLDPLDETVALGIDNLDVSGTRYNVDFVFTDSDRLYGLPKVFDFTSAADANSAVDAARAVLNDYNAVAAVDVVLVGNRTSNLGPNPDNFFLVGFNESGGRTDHIQSFFSTDTWINDGVFNGLSFTNRTYADFTAVESELDQIIQEFCADTEQATEDFVVRTENAASELQDCFDDRDDCTSGSGCLGDFRRCAERANRFEEQACSEFQREVRGAHNDAAVAAAQVAREADFLDNPAVRRKVDIAQTFGSLCGGPSDEPPAPDPNTVCETALCSNNGSPVRAGECGSAVDACKGYAGEDLETCVSLGLFICRGAVLPEEAQEPPTEPPSSDPSVCNQKLCELNPKRAQKCRVFFAACIAASPRDDECLGAAKLYCNANADAH